MVVLLGVLGLAAPVQAGGSSVVTATAVTNFNRTYDRSIRRTPVFTRRGLGRLEKEATRKFGQAWRLELRHLDRNKPAYAERLARMIRLFRSIELVGHVPEGEHEFTQPERNVKEALNRFKEHRGEYGEGWWSVSRHRSQERNSGSKPMYQRTNAVPGHDGASLTPKQLAQLESAVKIRRPSSKSTRPVTTKLIGSNMAVALLQKAYGQRREIRVPRRIVLLTRAALLRRFRRMFGKGSRKPYGFYDPRTDKVFVSLEKSAPHVLVHEILHGNSGSVAHVQDLGNTGNEGMTEYFTKKAVEAAGYEFGWTPYAQELGLVETMVGFSSEEALERFYFEKDGTFLRDIARRLVRTGAQLDEFQTLLQRGDTFNAKRMLEGKPWFARGRHGLQYPRDDWTNGEQ